MIENNPGKCKYEIEWRPTQSAQRMNNHGHGIEFHHKLGTERLVIGFIDGFDWLHGKSNRVNVYYLSLGSEEWGELASVAQHILKELRESVYEVLEKEIFMGEIRENIHVLTSG